MNISLCKQFWLTTFFLILTLIIFQITSFDLMVQDEFYDIKKHQWLISRDSTILKVIFYDGIKKVFLAFVASLVLIRIFYRKKTLIKQYKTGLTIVILSSIMVPLAINGLKAISNTPCPKHIKHYQGNYPDIKLFDHYPENFKQEKKVLCWPAGHASGGFSLLSLFFLFKSPGGRKKAVLAALTLGWSTGLYKMLIGDHFLSHTLVTMMLAWIMILIINYTVTVINSLAIFDKHNPGNLKTDV